MKRKTKKTKLTKFYIIEKSYGRFGEQDFTKATVKADKIENVILPEKFMGQHDDDDQPMTISRYWGFCGRDDKEGNDFTKVSRKQAYLTMEESVVGVGTTCELARAALQKADFNGDDDDWN